MQLLFKFLASVVFLKDFEDYTRKNGLNACVSTNVKHFSLGAYSFWDKLELSRDILMRGHCGLT